MYQILFNGFDIVEDDIETHKEATYLLEEYKMAYRDEAPLLSLVRV